MCTYLKSQKDQLIFCELQLYIMEMRGGGGGICSSGEQPTVTELLLHRYKTVSEHCHPKASFTQIYGPWRRERATFLSISRLQVLHAGSPFKSIRTQQPHGYSQLSQCDRCAVYEWRRRTFHSSFKILCIHFVLWIKWSCFEYQLMCKKKKN